MYSKVEYILSTKNRMIMGAFTYDRVVQLYNMLSKEAGLKETRDEAIASVRAEFYRNADEAILLLKRQEYDVYEKLLKILDEEEIRVVVSDAIMHFLLTIVNTHKFLSAMTTRERCRSLSLLIWSHIGKYAYEVLSNNSTIRSKFFFFKKSRTREIARELSKALEESSVRHCLLGEGYSRTLNYSVYTDPYTGNLLPKFASYVDEYSNVVL